MNGNGGGGSLGRHILVEFFNCDAQVMNDAALIEELMVQAARKADATVVNSTFHHFSPFGVSGVVVIEESHLAIHTWPEFGYAAVDLFTCGDSVDPWISYSYLEEGFKASHGSAMEILRGQRNLLERKDFSVSNESQGLASSKEIPRQVRNVWFTDRDDNIALSLRHKGDVLYRKQSPYQKVQILDTHAYGRTLTIDGMFMTTEKDEFVYHEMIAHVPLLSMAKASRVLVIGGGDGGTVREILKHSKVGQVKMVEIDEAVVEASKLHLPTLSSAFDHPKLELTIGDGIEYVAQCQDESYDLIIVDGSDPVGPAEGLFSEGFYRNVHRVLAPNGVLVAQSESPHFNTEAFKQMYACFRDVFGRDKVWPYLFFVPTYPTGMWSFAYCSKGEIHPLDSVDPAGSREFLDNNPMRYYNTSIHTAAFAIPNFVNELLDE